MLRQCVDRMVGGVYVAGKFENWAVLRQLQHKLALRGWSITFDWTVFAETPTEKTRENALWDLAGVRGASAFVAVLEGKECGTFVELGYALACETRCLIIDNSINSKNSVFYRHPLVSYVSYNPTLWVGAQVLPKDGGSGVFELHADVLAAIFDDWRERLLKPVGSLG